MSVLVSRTHKRAIPHMPCQSPCEIHELKKKFNLHPLMQIRPGVPLRATSFFTICEPINCMNIKNTIAEIKVWLDLHIVVFCWFFFWGIRSWIVLLLAMQQWRKKTLTNDTTVHPIVIKHVFECPKKRKSLQRSISQREINEWVIHLRCQFRHSEHLHSKKFKIMNGFRRRQTVGSRTTWLDGNIDCFYVNDKSNKSGWSGSKGQVPWR